MLGKFCLPLRCVCVLCIVDIKSLHIQLPYTLTTHQQPEMVLEVQFLISGFWNNATTLSFLYPYHWYLTVVEPTLFNEWKL